VQVSAALEAFSAEYHNLKAPRKLQYKPFLGSVQLVITAGGEQRDMRVTPLQVCALQKRQIWRCAMCIPQPF